MKTDVPSPKLQALLSGELTQEDAFEIYEQGKDAAAWAILALQQRVAELSGVNASRSLRPRRLPRRLLQPFLPI